MKYVLALDQGTTSSRAILFDRRGSIRSMAQQEFRQIYPRPGWVEHKPEDLWRSQLRVARRAVSRAGVSAEDIAAIGVANQRETTVIWDRETGKPIGNAIVWQDRRTSARCGQYLDQGHGDEIQKKTGLVLDPYFAGTKLQWMLQNIKGLRGRARRGQIAFGTVDSWLLWNLTRGKVHATDATNASRTLLFNIHSQEWDDDMLRLFDIHPSLLPETRSSSEVYGLTNILNRPIPVAGMAGDQQAALFGQTCFRRGMVKNTYGTGCFILMNTGTQPVVSKNKLLATIAWKIGDRTEYALEGSLFIAGAVVQWLRDELRIVRKAADIEALALKVPDNGGVCFVPAFAGLGAPHWDPCARGLIAGLTRGTTPAHLARAALEAVALQARDVVKAMEADSKIRLRELRVDGGASANNLLMQIQSDILNARVIRPRVAETTALGAAYLAGLAVGFWKEPRQLERHWKMDRAFLPGAKPKERARLLKGWEAAVARAKGWEDAEY